MITEEKAMHALQACKHNATLVSGLGSGLGQAYLNEFSTVEQYIQQQDARIKELEIALSPFAIAAAKFSGMLEGEVSAYIRRATGLLGGDSMAYMPMCLAHTSVKNWKDAMKAFAKGGA